MKETQRIEFGGIDSEKVEVSRKSNNAAEVVIWNVDSSKAVVICDTPNNICKLLKSIKDQLKKSGFTPRQEGLI